uniref:Uncharacterized protein n=1 Tax=Monopterus albus TaxID=43700 RepID=A0A3Q3QMC2_MONAL
IQTLLACATLMLLKNVNTPLLLVLTCKHALVIQHVKVICNFLNFYFVSWSTGAVTCRWLSYRPKSHTVATLFHSHGEK